MGLKERGYNFCSQPFFIFGLRAGIVALFLFVVSFMAEANPAKESNDKNPEQKSPGTYSPSADDQALIEKWKKRFTRAEEFLRPYRAKWLRMYKLYRAYQEKTNYAYQTRLMPPIAFQIVETVVSRLAVAKRRTRILPRDRKDAESKAIQSWDDLVNYDFDAVKLGKKMPRWLRSTTTYGNGIAKVTWLVDTAAEYDDPFLVICDLWDILPAPETEDLQDDCPWLIHRIVKLKEQIEKEEKNRGEETIYKNLEYVEPRQVEDWKKERYEINQKKIGQIQSTESKETEGATIKVAAEKYEKEKQVELWECWDYEEGKLVTIANREILIRNDDNPYRKVNNGRIFINLPDHELNWEFWAVGHIEPVETIIVEIADLRNQRMDDVILMLDPVIKIRKDAGISKNDIIFAPGAKWELRKMDDVVVEKLPETSFSGINEEKMLRDEIERTLAISEYSQGMPKSATEPLGKVAMLISQGNLRLSSLAQNVAEGLTQLANILIDMNQEFLDEDKLYRVVGDQVSFKEFKAADKEVKVDAIVEVEPVIPPDQDTRLNQAMLLYTKFVAEDKPDGSDAEEVAAWKKRKRLIQEMILDELGKSPYKTLLLGNDKPAEKTQNSIPEAQPAPEIPPPVPQLPSETVTPPPPGLLKRLLSKLPVIGKNLKSNLPEQK